MSGLFGHLIFRLCLKNYLPHFRSCFDVCFPFFLPSFFFPFLCVKKGGAQARPVFAGRVGVCPQAPEPGQGAKAASRRLHPFFSYKLPNRDGMTIWVCFRVRRVTEAKRGRKRPLVSRLTGVVFVCGMVKGAHGMRKRTAGGI